MKQSQKNYKHEMMSVKMFEHLLQDNNIKENEFFAQFTTLDWTFIKELIAGEPIDELEEGHETRAEDWKFHGRKKEKKFLYEIVNNPMSSKIFFKS